MNMNPKISVLVAGFDELRITRESVVYFNDIVCITVVNSSHFAYPAHILFLLRLASLNQTSSPVPNLGTAKKSVKQVTFHDYYNDQHCTIYVKEVLDAAYGCYIWPSALVMSDYVWYHRNMFKNSTILEIGAGTSLPSLVLAKASQPLRLVFSDIPDILPVVRGCLELNNLHESVESIWVRGLLWGRVGCDSNSVDQLVNDIEDSWKTSIDYIIGSDTFYDPKDFEDLLVTVAFIIHQHNPKCKFITAYQERSAKRSIQYLLDKWGLQCKLIPRESFEFDDLRFTDDSTMRIDDSEEEEGEEKKEEIDHKNEDIQSVKMNPNSLSSVFMLVISSK
ncbi:putative methyltransferase-domain-containing protein [Circinella umbellata]|nr:putative methyltransferase-domain-containing protein [Circinella umbellata]